MSLMSCRPSKHEIFEAHLHLLFVRLHSSQFRCILLLFLGPPGAGTGGVDEVVMAAEGGLLGGTPVSLPDAWGAENEGSICGARAARDTLRVS